jgi:hypothetical protein
MQEYLLKRALPFTLTFVVGAAVGGFFQFFGAGGARPLSRRHVYTFEGPRGCDKKFRRHAFEAAPASRRPIILFKPDAFQPRLTDRYVTSSVLVGVTFGADGKVLSVEQRQPHLPGALLAAVERAARQIQFVPATAHGEPTTVTEDVSIRIASE